MKQNDKGSDWGLEKLDDTGLWEVPGCSRSLRSYPPHLLIRSVFLVQEL